MEDGMLLAPCSRNTTGLLLDDGCHVLAPTQGSDPGCTEHMSSVHFAVRSRLACLPVL